VSGLPLRGSAEDHRALCTPDLTGLADAVPVSQVTWTSAQHIAADVAERH
jgi:hypothetical protein